MRFLLDHDVPDRVGHVLRQEGHEVCFLRDVLPRDVPDERVLDHAVSERMVLVTCNRDDFLGLVRERGHAGLIILIRRRTRIQECAAVLSLIGRAGAAGLTGNTNFA